MLGPSEVFFDSIAEACGNAVAYGEREEQLADALLDVGKLITCRHALGVVVLHQVGAREYKDGRSQLHADLKRADG